jgi:hypothetical protein
MKYEFWEISLKPFAVIFSKLVCFFSSLSFLLFFFFAWCGIGEGDPFVYFRYFSHLSDKLERLSATKILTQVTKVKMFVTQKHTSLLQNRKFYGIEKVMF